MVSQPISTVRTWADSVRWRLWAILCVSALFAGCAEGVPAGTTNAGAEPQASTTFEDTQTADVDTSTSQRRTLPTPGVGIQQGKVAGINAAHFGLGVALESVINTEGSLVRERFDTIMNSEMLDQAIEAYATSELPEDETERLAFLCNAYNANGLSVLSLIVTDFGDELSERGEPAGRSVATSSPTANESTSPAQRFDLQPVQVAGETMTLRTLREERILGGGDPRALACLLSVDRLRAQLPRESIWPRTIDEQFDRLCAQWVNTSPLADVHNGEVQISPALLQIATAFDGDPFGGVMGFLQRYADPEGRVGKAIRLEADSAAP